MAFYRHGSFDGDHSPRATVGELVRDDAHRLVLISAAKDSLISRRSRNSFFDKSIFGEPGWDMLLSLYISEETKGRNSVARLTDVAGAPPTIASRWIDHLGRLGLTRQVPHLTHPDTVYIELTDDGRHALDSYFGRMLAMNCDDGPSDL